MREVCCGRNFPIESGIGKPVGGISFMAEEEKLPVKQGGKLRWWLWSLGLVVLVGVIIGLLAAVVMGTFEPKYSEKPMSYWISELNGTNYIRREIAADALGKIGEPAIEPLVAALRKERYFSLTLREKIWLKLPTKWQAKVPRPYPADVMQFNALVGLAALGTNAARVAPDVILIFTNNSPALTSRATFALNRMGSNAVPALLNGTKSTNKFTAEQCRYILTQTRVDIPFTPEMIKSLEGTLLAFQVSNSQLITLAASLQYYSKGKATQLLATYLEHKRPEVCLRAAVLSANLGFSSQRIADLLIQDLENAKAEYYDERVSLLNGQRAYLQNHQEKIVKLAAADDLAVAVQFVQLADQHLGRSDLFWNVVGRLLAEDKKWNWNNAAQLLSRHKMEPRDQKEAVPVFSQLLKSRETPVLLHTLVQLQRGASVLWPLRPEVEKVSAEIAQDAKLKMLQSISNLAIQALKREEIKAKAAEVP